ncbi:hypothetical protein BS78_07G007500 [Paspalum vaginatum]|uniref:Uncharacterized protein n=1 Tax=Paspalum vaginatum TaxID=158149 RepID=A0A9W7X9B0_9POAL|nr:hypothetical protein BS78_K326600 [Paspalum vaginatum]KAJ1266815.1 hypothetical protein BS78_07G007500 [Paspalum vaginatum]
MDCEPEELQFLGVLGIYRASAEVLGGPHRPLFARIAAAFVLPLSALFLLHIAISHALFTHIDSDDTALDSSAPGTDAQRRLLSRLASDWLALLLFKSAYLVALLVLSLLSTAAAVFSVASVYSAKTDALAFPRVLSVVPRVWRRLAATFLAAFALLFAYNALSLFAFLGLLVAADNGSGFAGLLAFVVLVAYLVGLVYISVVWHLASVVSVLEDYKGFAAMRRSRDLIRGKLLTAAVIFVTLNVVFVVVEVAFRAWVVRGTSFGPRLLLGLLMLAALCCVVMLALVTQTLVYLVCKSYHHESIDKANISDHLEVYLGDYVPLKASDVQMEHFQV